MPNEVATTDIIDVESPAFAARLGTLLRASRREHHRSVRSTRAADDRFSVAQLRSMERGSMRLDEHLVAAVCQLYRTDLGTILPERPPITIEMDTLTALGTRERFVADDPRSLLLAYLRLIRAIRHQRKAPAVALRRADIEQLATFLDWPAEDIVDQLSALMGATAAERTALAALFASGAIVIGLATGTFAFGAQASAAEPTAPVEELSAPLGTASPGTVPVDDRSESGAETGAGTALAPDTDAATDVIDLPEATVTTLPTSDPDPADTRDDLNAATQPSPAVVLAPVPDVVTTQPALPAVAGSALTEDASAPIAGAINSPAPATGLAPAQRVQVPQAAPAADATPVVVDNESGCNTEPAASAMTVVIPDISYACPVYPGGQASIDDGFVTLMTDAGPNALLATHPGDAGTLWLAAHRTTHGGAFADVPTLADGATVTIADDTRSATYRVVGRAYVEVRGGRVIDSDGNATAKATWQAVVGVDGGGNGAPRLLLQTCDGDDYRWMIYAELVTE